jgi:hypothetical protein
MVTASDVTRSVSRHFNVITSEKPQRAAFIIDRTRQVRFSFIVQDHRLDHSIHTICTIVSFIWFIFVRYTNPLILIASNVLKTKEKKINHLFIIQWWNGGIQ